MTLVPSYKKDKDCDKVAYLKSHAVVVDEEAVLLVPSLTDHNPSICHVRTPVHTQRNDDTQCNT